MLKRKILITISKTVADQAEADQIKEFVRQKVAEKPSLQVSVIYHNSELIQEGS
ncbi:unnamed protein product [marine sediment metagenome]|uniref:Uncharacterized protein n=1 Tax=marine sediment metagenome TaxID=412755 RepID=X1ISE0_9ZZZZ